MDHAEGVELVVVTDAKDWLRVAPYVLEFASPPENEVEYPEDVSTLERGSRVFDISFVISRTNFL